VKKVEHLRRLELLILDDLGLEALRHNALIDPLNVLEDRVGRKGTIAAAQIPISKWHEYLGGDAIADVIMDRLIHTSEKIELKGESLRAKKKGYGRKAPQTSVASLQSRSIGEGPRIRLASNAIQKCI
jgi:DNA replication protein DnaC